MNETNEVMTLEDAGSDAAFGIWPPARAFYVEAMLFNARSAQTSITRVAEIIQGLSEGSCRLEDAGLVDEVLNGLQNIVLNGAALSRYFWPVEKGRQARGVELRALCSIPDDSALKSRSLRNDIEHMDERLDDYLANGVVGVVLPQYIGLSNEEGDGVPRHLFRAYFVDVGVFELLGQRYEIQPIADAIAAVGRALVGESP